MPPRREDELLRSWQEKNYFTGEHDKFTARRIQSSESAINSSNSTNDISRAIKASAIPAFSGKREERNSVTVGAYFYNLRKVAQMCSLDDAKLAKFRLQGKVAVWMETLEENITEPNTAGELRTAMFKKFVPANGNNTAKIKLVNLKMKSVVDEPISHFQDLANISQTPKSELYQYFP